MLHSAELVAEPEVVEVEFAEAEMLAEQEVANPIAIPATEVGLVAELEVAELEVAELEVATEVELGFGLVAEPEVANPTAIPATAVGVGAEAELEVATEAELEVATEAELEVATEVEPVAVLTDSKCSLETPMKVKTSHCTGIPSNE